MTKILNYKNNYSEIKKNMENSNTKRRFYETFKKNLDYVGETLRMEIKPS